MKKVTLIQPRSSDGGVTGAFFYKNIPSQGLIQLEALTPSDWEVQTVNENFEPIDFDGPVDVVGITALTSLAPRAYDIAKRYRSRGIPVIMGGIHASIYPEEVANHVDSVVVGEADELWTSILDDVWHKRLQPVYHATRPSHLDFNFQRRPKRTYSVGVSKYFSSMKSTYTYFQTGRGCPIGCDFCSVAQFNGKVIRKRSVEKLIVDIKAELAAHKVDYLVFMDDNIVADKAYAIELFKELAKLNVRWMSQTDIRITDPDIIDVAAYSGLAMVFLGLESINPDVLENSASRTKNMWHDRYESAIRELHKRGIAIMGSFMVGSDYDPPGVGEATAEWAIKNKLDTAVFHILTPLPGTALFNRLDAERRIITRQWDKYDLSHCVFVPKNRRPDEVLAEAGKAHRKFYSFWSIIRRMNNLAFQDLASSLFINFDFRKYGNL
ncbi:MAG: radical SAM protein [bacterium]